MSMSDYDDEYDEYNKSFDEAFLPYLTDLPPSPERPSSHPGSQPKESRRRPSSAHSEFSLFDLSEFTEEELAAFDGPPLRCASPASIAQEAEQGVHLRPVAVVKESDGGTSSGPAVEIEIEMPPTDHGTKAFEDKIPQDAPQGASSSQALTDAPSLVGLPRTYPENSAYYRWRRHTKVLSVSDLVGPAWCEVQFWYGLLGKRFKKIENRPVSFVTDTGKTININQATSVKMDKTQKRGTIIHKKLEKQIHPVEIIVEVATKEEKWGLRIVQMINAIESLVTIGKCREMPVFGIIQGQMIVGVIDEIERKPVDSFAPETHVELRSGGRERKRMRPTTNVPDIPSKSKSKKARRTPSPSQPMITAFFPSPSSPLKTDGQRPQADVHMDDDFPSSSLIGEHGRQTPPAAAPAPKFALYLSDNKTRVTPTLPLHEDTLGTRLQLMFYHKLLTGLLSQPGSEHAIDFRAMWDGLGLSPTRQFSSKFRKEAGIEAANCLAELEVLWQHAVDFLHVGGIGNTLTLVYRRQKRQRLGQDRKTKRSDEMKKSAVASDAVAAELLANPDSEVAKVAESLSGVAPVVKGMSDHISRSGDPVIADELTSSNPAATNSFAMDHRQASPDAVDNPELQWPLQQTLMQETTKHPHVAEALTPDEPSSGDASSSNDENAQTIPRGSIIGTKVFQMDNKLVDSYLTDILSWWYGLRSPRGVEIQLTRRCLSCEYREDCEWREAKAEEVMKVQTPAAG